MESKSLLERSLDESDQVEFNDPVPRPPLPDLSLYTILQVTKDATDEDIKNSYRRLSRLFHPDRHRNEQSKMMAHKKFQTIQRAMDVLSDPKQREIYDNYGEAGLQAGWAIQKRDQTLEELKKEVRRSMQKADYDRMDALCHSRTEMSSSLSLLPLFAHEFLLKSKDSEEDQIITLPIQTRAALCGFSNLSLKHSFMIPFSISSFRSILFADHVNDDGSDNDDSLRQQDTEKLDSVVDFDFTLATRGDTLDAAVMTNVKHAIASNKSIQFGFNPLNLRQWQSKFFLNPSTDTSVLLQADGVSLNYPPTINATVTRRITHLGTASFMYRSGLYALGSWGAQIPLETRGLASQFVLGWTQYVGKSMNTQSPSFWQTQVVASPLMLGLIGEYHYPIFSKSDHPTRGIVQASLTTANQSVSLLASRKVTEFTSLSLGFSLGITTGNLSLKLVWSRLGQKIVIPIALASTYDSNAILIGLVTPFTLIALYESFIRIPNESRKRIERIKRRQKARQKQYDIQKEDALEIVKMMSPVAKAKKEQEQKENGLAVEEAMYCAAKGNEAGVDVSIPLTSLIVDHQLLIKGGVSKAQLPGFYDLFPGRAKKLVISYIFGNKRHSVTVADLAELIIPQRKHCIE